MIREQLASLQREQQRLEVLLAERETDLRQLRNLIEDLSYSQSANDPTMHRWASKLGTLHAKEAELQEGAEHLRRGLEHVGSLVTALSSISTLGSSRQLKGSGVPFEAAVAERALQGQEAERSRLAREVHDGPAQVLANAIMALEYCERLLEKRPAAVPDELRRIKQTMTEGLEEVRRFIFDLRPSSLEHEGLKATLERYAADFEHRFAIAVSVCCQELEDILSSEQRFVMFRIIQEAMQNCRKHAVASRLSITVERHNGEVDARVADNGKGFDLESNRFREGHYGLQGMRERAEAVQGRVIVFSEPGNGTEVCLRVPVLPQAVRSGPS